MQKINKNYIYVVIIILIVGGLFLFQSRDKDLALEVINDDYTAEEIESSDMTASLLSSAPKKMMTLKIYFPNTTMTAGGTNNCQEVFPVNRSVVETIAPARASLEELFRGPTIEEKELGFSTVISSDIKIQKLTINEGIATIDVNTLTGEETGDKCKEASSLAEITETLKQFLTVDNVSISVNGVIKEKITE
ncbi:MAG: GerMN domain-containing protein [Parcubacteria group bacterium]|nr:GerMN domain-containing protein [Parcubacteria group bacterium]MCR4342345.1 GerMN domain-containing protein [Patescibacteria group bacterium]